MKNLVKELEKFEKEKIKLRASEFGARRDREFWKRRATMPIETLIKSIEEVLKDPERHITDKNDLINMINTNNSNLDEKIIVSCKLSDLKYLKKEASIFKTAKELEKRVKKVEELMQLTGFSKEGGKGK